MGKEGFRAWEAVRDAGEELGIAPLYWCVDYTGGRSLHFELIPEAPVPYRDAHRIAKALGELVRRAGQAVCTVYPTNRTGDGKLLRLPCGRHRKTGVHGCFVEPGLRELRPRPTFRNDTGYLKLIARVPGDVLTEAATLAAAVVQEAPQAQAEPQEVAQVAHDPRPAQGGRFTQTDPALAQRIGRPCILWLIEHGVPEGHRHDVALLLRTELKACGFTPEEALPVYRRFARACTPPWAPEEADATLGEMGGRDGHEEASPVPNEGRVLPHRIPAGSSLRRARSLRAGEALGVSMPCGLGRAERERARPVHGPLQARGGLLAPPRGRGAHDGGPANGGRGLECEDVSQRTRRT